MEVEKRSSKGGFLQLFDWNAKAKKKLFSNKSELPEGSKQGKENFDSSSTSQSQQMKVNENVASCSFSEHYNCASSVTSDEGCTSRAPGVVARLMGLDSMPTFNISDHHSTPFCYSKSLHHLKSHNVFKSEHQMIGYGNTKNMVDGFSGNLVKLELQKVPNRPIERFQTEMLPPKAAKSIPITHHRLLSPIRSPGFVPTKNPVYIMEAAAKIIEQSPRSTAKVKLASFGSSSVPLRIRHLKEKMETTTQKAPLLPETSQRLKEHRSVKLAKGPSSERNQRGSKDALVLKTNVSSGLAGSDNSKDKDKSVSPAMQAKVNAGKIEGLTSSTNRSFTYQKGDNEVKLSNIGKNQHKQKNMKKRTSTGKTSNVLRQNNQKQNCAVNKERVNVKPSVSNEQHRKSVSMNSSLRSSKTVNKVVVNSMVGAKKTNLFAANNGNETAPSRIRNFSTKKQLVCEDDCVDGSSVDSLLIKRGERHVKCNIAVDGHTNLDAGDRNNCTDVVSFTFNSPIKKTLLESNSSGQPMEKSDSLCFVPYGDQSNSKNSSLSSLGLNKICGDALSALLEQKLKELTYRLQTSHDVPVKECLSLSSESSFCASNSTLNEGNTEFTENDRRSQLDQHGDRPEIQYDIDCSSVDDLMPKEKQEWQELERCKSDNNGEYAKEYYQYPSAVSSLEHSFFEESYSSDSKASLSSPGWKEYKSTVAYEKVWISAKVPPPVDGEMELLDSVSPVYVESDGEHINATFFFTNVEGSSDWVLKYVRCLLDSAELMLMEFATGQITTIISPDLFDQLENKKARSNENMDEQCKLGRKILFDCVNECLESRCRLLFHGPPETWAKWITLFWKECLAEELYSEISSWTCMENLMVDELVDNDMSTQYGKWVDFGVEIFEEEVEIENGILTILVDELVADLLSFHSIY